MRGRKFCRESVTLLGVRVTPFRSYEQAVARVAKGIEAGRKSFWVAVNPEKIYRAWRDPRLAVVLRRANVGICDGIGVSYAAKLLTGRYIPRCTGCDLFGALIAAAAARRWGVFLLGASPVSNQLACENLQAKYPALEIVGSQHGYFDDDEAIVRQINDSGADLLFVAKGSPAQEFWIAEHIDDLQVHLALGVGGSLDVASGKARRAPWLLRKTGMEFFYRALTTPGWSMRARVERTAVKFKFAAAVVRRWLGGAEPRPVESPT